MAPHFFSLKTGKDFVRDTFNMVAGGKLTPDNQITKILASEASC